MAKGTAKAWKEAYIQDIVAGKYVTFGPYSAFLDKVHKAFATADVEGDAQATL